MSNYYLYNNKVIDLNLLKYKNEIAVSLSRYFDETNLQQIEFNKLCLNFDTIINKDKSNQYIKLYNYKSSNDTIFELVRELDISKLPLKFYIELHIENGFSNFRVKCKIDNNVGANLNSIIAESLNYINYGNITNNIYNRKEIQVNFSKILAKYCNFNNLSNARDKISNELDYDKMLDENSCNYEYKFQIDDVIFEFNNFRYNTILFGIIFDNIKHYIYLPRSQVGFSLMYLLIDKATAIVNYLSQI